MTAIKEYDKNGNLIHHRHPDGFEAWREFDENNNLIHYQNSDGREFWYDEKGKKHTTLV